MASKRTAPPAQSKPVTKAEVAFEQLVRAFAATANVKVPDAQRRKFGSNGLKVNGKIFAMLVRGELVLKLPAARVAALVSSGQGAPFDAGKGKPMKEWLVVRAREARWLALTREAFAFVNV